MTAVKGAAPVLPARPTRPPSPTSARRSRRRLPPLANVLLTGVMVVWTVTAAGPLVWMLLNSLRSSQQIASRPFGPPSLANLQNYSAAWTTASIGQALLNSLLVSVGAVLLSLALALLIGFALSRGRLPFSNVLLTFFLGGLLIPGFSLLLPLVFQFQSVGLTSNRLGLVLVYAGLNISLGVFLFKVAFDGVPNDYVEAAFLDGCSVPRLLLSVLVPMVRPTIGTFAILAFLATYNDFVFTLVLNNDPALNTLPIAILSFSSGQLGTRYNLVFAAVAIATIPPLVAYLFLRRQVQQSVAAGGRTG